MRNFKNVVRSELMLDFAELPLHKGAPIMELWQTDVDKSVETSAKRNIQFPR
jgi:hypothetical protein